MPDISSGACVYGLDFPPSQYDQDWTPLFALDNTTASAGNPVVSVTVTAPTSGRVMVAIGAGLRNNDPSARVVIVSYVVRVDSSNGPEVQGFMQQYGVKSIGIGNEQFRYMGNYSLVEDLLPGRSYYFEVQHMVSAGDTCDISSRNILVFPVP